MKIRKMTAHFGALDGRTLELSGGLNILYAPNESGKSTWCAFLCAMLYGISTSQRARADRKPDRVRYQPWSGAPMSGSMELETPDGAVTLRRWTERADRPMQAFSATVTGTDIPVSGITADTAGETLTGVSREVFERSAFIRQAGIAVTNDPALDRRLRSIVTSGDEEISYQEAQERLKAWQRRRRSGKRGAIPELEAKIADAGDALSALQREADAARALEGRIASLEVECGEAVERMQRARSEQRKRALRDMAAAREQTEQARAAVKRAEDRLKEADARLDDTPYGDMGAERAARRSESDMEAAAELKRRAEKLPPVKLAYIPLALAALAFALALILPWRTGCAAAGGILILLFVVMFARLRGLARTKADMLAERQRILDAYGVDVPDEIESLLETYRVLWGERERAALRLEKAGEALDEALDAQKRTEARTLELLDFARGDNEAARAGREAERLRAELSALRERRAAVEGRASAIGDRMALESELQADRELLSALREQERAIALALETLAAADDELSARFSPLLAQKASEYFSYLTDGRYDELTLSRELEGRARPAGQDAGREAEFLSLGAKDQLYLALRLAVCELALPKDDPCPIVLDDALVNFDSERLARALELLRGLSEERQILLFTCHERETEYFASDAEVTRLTLE